MLRFCNCRAVSFWPIRVLAFCKIKLGGSLSHRNMWLHQFGFQNLTWDFGVSFFLRHSERHFHFLSSISLTGNINTVTLCCLAFANSVKKFTTPKLFHGRAFHLGPSSSVTHQSTLRINLRRYHLAKPRKRDMAVALLANYTGWQELFV